MQKCTNSRNQLLYSYHIIMKNTYHYNIPFFVGQFRPRNSFPVQVALWFRLRPWTAPTPAQILGCSMLFLKLEASTKNRKKQNTVQSSNMAMESMGGFSILPCLMTGGFHAFEMVLSIESHGLAVIGQGFSGGLYPPKRGIISWLIIHLCPPVIATPWSIWQCVKTLYPCISHQNSWDSWMFIPLKMVLIGIDPYPSKCPNRQFPRHSAASAAFLFSLFSPTPRRAQPISGTRSLQGSQHRTGSHRASETSAFKEDLFNFHCTCQA